MDLPDEDRLRREYDNPRSFMNQSAIGSQQLRGDFQVEDTGEPSRAGMDDKIAGAERSPSEQADEDNTKMWQQRENAQLQESSYDSAVSGGPVSHASTIGSEMLDDAGAA
jgi:ubiquitin